MENSECTGPELRPVCPNKSDIEAIGIRLSRTTKALSATVTVVAMLIVGSMGLLGYLYSKNVIVLTELRQETRSIAEQLESQKVLNGVLDTRLVNLDKRVTKIETIVSSGNITQ